MILAEPVDPGLVAQQCVLVASEKTDIIDDKNITTLNVVNGRELNTFTIEEHHRLY